MNFKFRRLLVLLALTVTLSMLTVPALAEEAEPILLGQTLTVNITEPGQTVRFRFVPEETALYVFRSVSDGDTYGKLLDSEGNLLTSNDDGGNGSNFEVRAELQAGETYFWEAQYYRSSATGSFSVTLEALRSDPITVGQTLTVDITEPGQTAQFRFVPEHTTTYIFQAASDGDTYGQIVDIEGRVLAYNDDTNEQDFEVRTELQAGETYFWVAWYANSTITGSFSVTLEMTHNYQPSVLEPSTCTEGGLLEYRCIICGDSYTVDLPPIHRDSDCDGCDITAPIQGVCGDEVYWGLTEDGCLVLWGTGSTWDFIGYETEITTFSSSYSEKDPAPWKDYYRQITSIRISPGITDLGEYIFWSLAWVEELTLPEGLISTGYNWLDYCEGLQRLHVSSTVTSLGGSITRIPHLREIRFEGLPTDHSLLLYNAPDGIVILYHSSCPGWEKAIGSWDVPEDARWLDMDNAIDPEELAFAQQEYTVRAGESVELLTNADPYTDYLLSQWSCKPEGAIGFAENMAVGLLPGTFVLTRSSVDGSCSASCTITVTGEEIPDSGFWELGGAFSENRTEPTFSYYDLSEVTSCLYQLEDGTLERVFHIRDSNKLVRSRFDLQGNLLSEEEIPKELPLFGGIFRGEAYNYILFGQGNEELDSGTEVIRIVRYTKDWQRVDACSFIEEEPHIKTPFSYGNLAIAEWNGTLRLHIGNWCGDLGSNTSYSSRMDMTVDLQTMEVIDTSSCKIYNTLFFSEDGLLYQLKSEGSYSTGVSLLIHDPDAQEDPINIPLLPLEYGPGNAGSVPISVFEVVHQEILVAGHSAGFHDPGQHGTTTEHNIFLLNHNQETGRTRSSWLTSYTQEDDPTVHTPHLVAVTEGLYLMLWEEFDSEDKQFMHTQAILVDHVGNAMGSMVTLDCRISDCQPIVTAEGLVVWYASSDLRAVLYGLNWQQMLTDPDGIEQQFSHQVQVTDLEPTCVDYGCRLHRCDICLWEKKDHLVVSPGHIYDEWVIETEATCTGRGWAHRICTVCQNIQERVIDPFGHSFRRDVCTRCGADRYGDNSSIPDVTQYSYTITPIVSPFAYFLYVKTDNPDPTSFRLVDRESALYGPDDHTMILIRKSGSMGYSVDVDPGTYYIVQNIFPDVEYEDETIWRVPGGYIFQGNDAYSDGGEFVLLQKISCGADILGDTFKETAVTIPCESLTLGRNYLLEHCTDADLGLFENLDQIVAFLEEYAVYPRGLYDSNDPNLSIPYPFWCSSYWAENSLYTTSAEYDDLLYGSLLFEAYPYILDSLGYPGKIGAAAEALEPGCTVESGDAHYEVVITFDGEQRVYGGDGEGPSGSFDAARAAKLFTFQGADDLSADNSLSRCRDTLRNQAYLLQASQAEEADYFVFVKGDVFQKYMEEQGSSWLQVLTEGLGYGVNFAYMAYADGNICVMSDAWVDGRYVGEREIINLHATFEEHPQADILLHDVTYTDRNGQTRTTDVLFEYNDALDAWVPDWPSSANYGSPEELPEELILTQEEVASLDIDRNKDHWPDHGLIYDGTVFPGTPFEIKLVSGISIPETLELVIGQEYMLIPEVTPADANDIRTNWEVTDETILKLTGYLDRDKVKLTGLAEGTVVVTATTVDGAYSASCTVTVVAACTEHSYLEEVSTPGCTEGGYTAYTCERCGDSYTGNETEPLGHDFENGICALCGEVEPVLPENPFSDVPEGTWYSEPVLWAMGKGITAGVSVTSFAPDQTCTRAQVVTFLWRAFGKQTPTQTENPFIDVSEGDYFYDAVLWAVENDITAGMTATTFEPNNPCTRAQVVTFLWRAMDKPVPEQSENPFIDVDEGWFFDPVLWAVEKGITTGMRPDAFGPNNPCIRAQVVTFLYRVLKDK